MFSGLRNSSFILSTTRMHFKQGMTCHFHLNTPPPPPGSSVSDDLERVQVGRQDDSYNNERSSEFEPRSDSGK